MPPEFAITEHPIDAERHVLAVRGEIDLFTAPELKQVLAESIEAGRNRIVVDLTETTFLDSTALGVLIGAVKRLRSRDGALAIVNVDENIAKTFEITGLDQIFTILPTRDDADRSGRRGARQRRLSRAAARGRQTCGVACSTPAAPAVSCRARVSWSYGRPGSLASANHYQLTSALGKYVCGRRARRRDPRSAPAGRRRAAGRDDQTAPGSCQSYDRGAGNSVRTV